MISDNSQSAERYPSDLSDDEWEILRLILEEIEPYTTGRPRTIPFSFGFFVNMIGAIN